jgi:hypothetical protein
MQLPQTGGGCGNRSNGPDWTMWVPGRLLAELLHSGWKAQDCVFAESLSKTSPKASEDFRTATMGMC